MINSWCNDILRFIILMRFPWVFGRITFSFISLAPRCSLARTRSLLGSRVLRILLIVVLRSFIRWKGALTARMAQALPFRITLPLLVAAWPSGRRRRLLNMRVNLTRPNQEMIWLVVDNKDLSSRHYELPYEFIYWLAAICLYVKWMPELIRYPGYYFERVDAHGELFKHLVKQSKNLLEGLAILDK